MLWCIINIKGEYWSNEWGWGSKTGCDVFTIDQVKTMNLPIGGQWRKYR